MPSIDHHPALRKDLFDHLPHYLNHTHSVSVQTSGLPSSAYSTIIDSVEAADFTAILDHPLSIALADCWLDAIASSMDSSAKSSTVSVISTTATIATMTKLETFYDLLVLG